ncbi:MAG: hypothetical protein HKO66_09880 [Saprospiraceae bacterium]|nr:hypothetical protein [Bacteroidia bacterium]NNE13534.1 hypothetical protein [Saprospiraceae bacterium]NNL92529.1 hypothetical protein [Saprospiraceae bacterium]
MELENHFNKLGFYSMLGSFFIGTLILLMFIITRNENIVFFGMLYVWIAVIYNACVALFLFGQIIFENALMVINIKSILLLLVNIPIAFLYLCLVMAVLDAGGFF